MGLFHKLKKQDKKEDYYITCPVKGNVIDIKEIQDPLFSGEALGKGVGIIAKGNIIVAPVSGTISTFFPTKHAIGIKSDGGIEVLIHVGIDTVELEGKCFKALRKQGDSISEGEALLEVDFHGIKEQGYDGTVMMVITNTNDYKDVKLCLGEKEVLETVIEIEKE